MLKKKIAPVVMALTLLVGGTAVAVQTPLEAKACDTTITYENVWFYPYPGYYLSMAIGGHRDDNVNQLQFYFHSMALSNPAYYDQYYLDPDGYFGANTKRVVMNFQRNHGLVVDGIVGPATWNLIGSEHNWYGDF